MDPVSFLIKCATHAAGNRLREIQAVQEREKRERIAAEEKAREERDPQYRAAKEAERHAAEERAIAQRAIDISTANRQSWDRGVRTIMFWLSFLSGVMAFWESLDGGSSGLLTLAWLGFGIVWIKLLIDQDM